MNTCIICGKELNYEPQRCCSGRDCGCGGGSIDPPVCSEECFDVLIKGKENG